MYSFEILRENVSFQFLSLRQSVRDQRSLLNVSALKSPMTVDEIAAALAAKNVPFLFVTGYGPGSLPKAFAETAMLPKPFSQEQLIATVASLVEAPAVVYRLRK